MRIDDPLALGLAWILYGAHAAANKLQHQDMNRNGTTDLNTTKSLSEQPRISEKGDAHFLSSRRCHDQAQGRASRHATIPSTTCRSTCSQSIIYMHHIMNRS